MKRLFTLTMLVLASMTAFAQFPNESPYPGEFRVIAPSQVSGTYTVGRQVAWGDTLTQTICGDLVWAHSTIFDSLGGVVGVDTFGCKPILEDLTGKIAVMTRGPGTSVPYPPCNFSLKAYHAQQAGAIGVVIVNHYDNAADTPTTANGMSAGDSAAAVHIPAVLMSRADREAIVPLMDAGETVQACFYVPNFDDAQITFSRAVPYNEAKVFETVGATYFNLSDTEVTLNAKCDVIDPNGAITTLTQALTIPAASDSAFVFSDNYELTAGEGDYTFVYTNDINSDTLIRVLEAGFGTFAVDNLDLNAQYADDWTSPADTAAFFNGGLLFDAGVNIYTGTNDGDPSRSMAATAVSFAVHNMETFLGDQFAVAIYDLDSDGNGVMVATLDYNNTTEMGLAGPNADAYVEVLVTDTMNNDEIITIMLPEPFPLKDNNEYLVMVRYDGNSSGLGVIPAYSSAGDDPFPALSTVIFLGGNFSSWNGDAHNIVRLHVDKEVNTEDFKPLDAGKVSAFPTPASDFINVKLDLEGVNDNAVIRLVDLQGRVVNQFNLTNVQSGTYVFDVRDVPAGHYFINAETKEGFRAIKVQVAH